MGDGELAEELIRRAEEIEREAAGHAPADEIRETIHALDREIAQLHEELADLRNHIARGHDRDREDE